MQVSDAVAPPYSNPNISAKHSIEWKCCLPIVWLLQEYTVWQYRIALAADNTPNANVLTQAHKLQALLSERWLFQV